MKTWVKYGVALALCWGQIAQADYEEPSAPATMNPMMPDGRNWSAAARGYAGWADNVPLADDDAFFETSSAFVGGSLEGSINLFEAGGWSFGAAGRLDTTRYLEDDDNSQLDAFSTVTGDIAFYGSTGFMVQDMPAQATVSYDFISEQTDDVDSWNVDAHRVSAGVAVEATDTVSFNVAVTVADEDYDLDVAFDERDSTRVTAGVGATVRITDDIKADVGYRYTDNDADGATWAYSAHQISGSVTAVLSDYVLGRVQASYESRDYGDVVGPFARSEQDVTVLVAQALAHVTDNVDLDASIRHEIYETDVPGFEADDTRIVAGISYRF
jgi:hypothetical protein